MEVQLLCIVGNHVFYIFNDDVLFQKKKMALRNHNYFRPKITRLLAIIFLLNLACKGPNRKVINTDPVPKIEKEMNVAYIGTYTKKEGHVNGKAEGIYTVYQDAEDGSIRFGATVESVVNPSRSEERRVG